MNIMEQEVRTIGQYFNMKTILSFIIGVIVGVLFAVPLVERGKLGTDFFAGVFNTEKEAAVTQTETSATNASSRGASAVSVLGENSLVVGDQRAGFSVIMSMVSLSESGWVAIHEETDDGQMGNILGARRFVDGKYFGSAIELLRATEGGRAYFAVLHRDNGDSVFDFEMETPVRDAADALVAARFIATFSE